MIRRTFKIFGFAAFNLIALELLLRAVNAVYPLEMPARFRSAVQTRWIQGFDTYNGKTRLYHYQPNSIGVTHGHAARFNRWGFRGANFEKRSEAGAGVFRVMVLGDSVTMGQAVAQDDRFTDRTEALLRAKRPDASFEIINLGVQGFETLQEYKILRIMGDAVGPNLAVVAFWLNDPNLHYRYYPTMRFPLKGVWEKLRSLLTVRIAENLYDPLVRRIARIPSHDEEVRRAYDPSSEDWKIFSASVEGIAAWAKKTTGRAPVALYLPDPDEAGKRGLYAPVKQVFEKNGYDWLESPAGVHRNVSRWDAHPSPSTHAAYAEVLASYLEKSLPREPRSPKA